MKYEKIRGKSVSECMMKIRSLHGSAAIILSTREVQEGGLLGSGLFSKKLYEIDFMIEEKKARGTGEVSSLARPAEQRVIRPPRFERLKREEEAPSPEIAFDSRKPATSRTSAPRRNPPPSDLPENLLVPHSAEEILSLLGAEEEAADPAETAAARRAHETPDDVEPYRLSATSRPEDERSVRYFHKIRGRLLGAHLSRDFTEAFLTSLDHSMSRVEKEEYRKVEEKSVERLAQLIRTTPDLAPPRGECRAVMLIGPTGTGKTTSLAKLAAKYHIFENREVSLYSLDHYRLAATEQLKTYAHVMGLPFHAPLNPQDFQECIRRDGAELMLVDTSGINHRNPAKLAELKKFVDACEVRLEKHLVLSANTAPDLIEKILLAYDALGFDKIILTKLDETDFIGAFIEHADKFNRPFSFLMNGQEVPGDILEPRPIDMARLVLREEST